MSFRDPMTEIVAKMDFLKLSSPLRTDSSSVADANENKENLLGFAGQDPDIPKAKSEVKTRRSSTPISNPSRRSVQNQSDGNNGNEFDEIVLTNSLNSFQSFDISAIGESENSNSSYVKHEDSIKEEYFEARSDIISVQDDYYESVNGTFEIETTPKKDSEQENKSTDTIIVAENVSNSLNEIGEKPTSDSLGDYNTCVKEPCPIKKGETDVQEEPENNCNGLNSTIDIGKFEQATDKQNTSFVSFGHSETFTNNQTVTLENHISSPEFDKETFTVKHSDIHENENSQRDIHAVGNCENSIQERLKSEQELEIHDKDTSLIEQINEILKDDSERILNSINSLEEELILNEQVENCEKSSSQIDEKLISNEIDIQLDDSCEKIRVEDTTLPETKETQLEDNVVKKLLNKTETQLEYNCEEIIEEAEKSNTSSLENNEVLNEKNFENLNNSQSAKEELSTVDTEKEDICDKFISAFTEEIHEKDPITELIKDNPHSEEVNQLNCTVEVPNEQNLENHQEQLVNIPNTKEIEYKMTEEKLQQELSDLKLELNASKQANTKLELEIGKKDEIILKTQAEALKKEQQYQQEMKLMKEQLKEKSNLNEKNFVKDLEEALKEAKAKESQALSELNARINDELNYRKIMEEYEKTIAVRVADCQKLKEENETVTRHLANLELSFSDLHQKYERTKTIIHGFKSNEELLRKKFADFEEVFHKQEEKYESLKAHAKAQIEKSNKEIMQYKEKYDDDVNKLRAIIKRQEIKIAALETSLEQKTQECIALAALCDEVTGKKF